MCSELTRQFLDIYGKCPSRLQKRILEPMKMSPAPAIVSVCERGTLTSVVCGGWGGGRHASCDVRNNVLAKCRFTVGVFVGGCVCVRSVLCVLEVCCSMCVGCWYM